MANECSRRRQNRRNNKWSEGREHKSPTEQQAQQRHQETDVQLPEPSQLMSSRNVGSHWINAHSIMCCLPQQIEDSGCLGYRQSLTEDNGPKLILDTGPFPWRQFLMIFSATKAWQKYKAVTLAQTDLLQLPLLLKTVHHILLTKFVFFSVCT